MKMDLGLSSHDALHTLSRNIRKELSKTKTELETSESMWEWIKDGFLHSSPLSTFSWTSGLLVMLEVIVFVICFTKDCTERSNYLPLEGFILLVILFVNIYIVGWDAVQRQREMWFRAENIYGIIDKCLQSDVNKNWKLLDYPHLFMPQSPCISLQWTYREGQLVNLPLHLLVENDVIAMRPGHPAPGKCESLEKLDGKTLTLNSGDYYVPSESDNNPSASATNFQQSQLRFRKQLVTANFVMKETPYISALKLCLKKSLERPTTLFNRERHTIVSGYLEKMTIPVVLVFVICIEALHIAYVVPERCHWAESLVLRPALTLLPLLPLALPSCWFLLNVTGVAYLLAMMDVYSHAQLKKPLESYNEVDEDAAPPRCAVKWHHMKTILSQLLFSQGGYLWRSSNLLQVLGSVTTFCCIDKKGILSWPNPFPEKVFFLRSNNTDQETLSNIQNHTSISNFHHFNPHQTLEHQYHLHHSHGGIAGEAVSLEDNTYFSTPSLLNDFNDDADSHACVHNKDSLHSNGFVYKRKISRIRDPIYIQSGSRAEVLDLTHNVANDFAVEFDDPKWKKHLNSLKPLGLSILVNTCNPAAQEYYSKFCDHITCESLSNDAAVPVVNKRCLCELARQIGFTDSAIESYQLQELLAVFRHVQPDVVRKGRLARSLNLSRLKMPFPYLSCAVIKDPHTGSHQLFSQGTGDLLIDTCSDFWNGKGLSTLSESDRKRILDFYHRSSLTAYCMAFSYAPLPRPPKPGLAEKYLELPPDSSHTLRHRLCSESSGGASPSRGRGWVPDNNFPNELFSGDKAFHMKPYLSTDSLLFMKEIEEEKAQEPSKSDKIREEAFLDVLSHQIFIGMVTMQYQACPDIVQLIELLDKSCIRFVHFSKENELRSRVFSEKMGLESGWNCHISLLSQRSRSESGGSNQQANTSWMSVQESDNNHFQMTSSDSIQIGDFKLNKVPVRCVSAPSLVNLETYTVRFEDEVSLYSSHPSECDQAMNEQQYAVYFRDGENNYLPPDIGSELQPLNSNSHMLETPFGRNIREQDGNNSQPNGNRRYSSTRLRGSTLSQSPSHVTESTDQSVPVTFDMSNRAKLPKGIENIRPHLDHVDNVPLLVSLFTDCTPEATKDMIKIMQDYGEVVACVGSSANVQNMPIFLQADVSIGMEPLFPQLCRDQPIFTSDPRSNKREFWTPNGDDVTSKLKKENPSNNEKMAPTELSRHLNLLPCSFGIHRDDPISLYHLIMEARHLASGMQNSLQFMLCCCLSLSLIQILSSLFFLPAPLAPSHCIWLVCFQVPILALSLVGNPCDPQCTTMAMSKNLKVVSKQTVFFFLGCYSVKFCPSVIVTCICFGVTVGFYCNNRVLHNSKIITGLSPATCWIFSPPETNITSTTKVSIHENLVWASSITISQNLVAFITLLYFVIISVGFVQRMHLLWERNPFQNRYWALACIFVLLFQLIFSVIDIMAYAEGTKVLDLLEVIPFYIWIVAFLWPLPLLLINALIKRYEIKVNIRQQKRVRLEFGTKLGMNSPF